MTEPSEASVSRRAASFELLVPPSIVLAFPLFVFVLVVQIVVVIVVVEIVVVLVVVVVRCDVELEGRQAGDFEVAPALGTTQLVPLVDVEFIDFDFGVAFWAGGHSDYYNHA